MQRKHTPGVSKPPTIVDVAALAGVSKSTVSAVIRDAGNVTERTRRRVLDAVERLGYRPNVVARQLVQRRSSMIGVLIGDLDNPFYAQIAPLVEQAAFHAGYTTMFSNVEQEGRHTRGVDALLEHRVAGVLALAPRARSEAVRARLEDQVPTVFVGLRGTWGDVVVPDDVAGARLAVEHLVAHGHRRIGCVMVMGADAPDRDRYAGYAAAMRDNGLVPLPQIVWRAGDRQARVGERTVAVASLLERDERPTALFASNDLGAIALQDLADERGLRVPEDLAIVGFDDIALAGMGRISLTSVAQPLDQLARVGVETLIARIDGTLGGPTPRAITLPVRLVARASSGGAP